MGLEHESLRDWSEETWCRNKSVVPIRSFAIGNEQFGMRFADKESYPDRSFELCHR